MKIKRKSRAKRSLSTSRRSNNPSYQYEILKAALPADLTPSEYQAACRRIADELGI